MCGLTGRGVKCFVVLAASLAICSPIWAQGKNRDGGGKGGSGRDGGNRAGSGRGAEMRSGSEVKRDDGVRSSTPRSGSSGTVRSESKQGTSAARRDSSSRRELTVDDSWRQRDRDGDRGRDRDRDHDRRWDRGWNRWDRDFGFGFNLGPISGYYGPWYRYYGPWQGFYGPGYGYYGPWSGTYAYGWPYYYDDGIYGDRVIGSAYSAPEAISTDGTTVEGTAQAQTQAQPPPRREPTTTPEGREFLRRAEEAFRRGQNDEAVRLANHAAVEMPNSGRVFLFLSQALFAVGDYGAAAGALHQGMAMSDPKEWGTIVQNFRQYYSDPNEYTEQLRRLEKFVEKHSDAPYAHFLLGFQYGYLSYPEEARRELAEAVRMEQRDDLAAQLLVQFGGEAPRREKAARENRSGDEGERTPRPEVRDEETQRSGKSGDRRDDSGSKEPAPPPE